MKGLIQRVAHASVVVDGECIAEIKQGLLLFLGVEKGDTAELNQRMLDKVLSYRVFEDDDGRMNRSLRDVHGDLLVVSQFTLAADTRKGARPSFSSAAPPEHALNTYKHFIDRAQEALAKGEFNSLGKGQFGADMKISLLNDGPVTFLLELS